MINKSLPELTKEYYRIHIWKAFLGIARRADWLRASFTRLKPLLVPQRSLYEKVQGHEIFYEIEGNGNHPVLLIPGALGSTVTDFPSQMGKTGIANQDEAQGRFTVVCLDPPGYGKSKPERTWPQKFFERDGTVIVEFMRQLGLTPFSIVGWSDGGILALTITSMLAKPEEIRSLVVFGANAYITEEEKGVLQKIRDVTNWSERMRKSFEDVYGAEKFKNLWAQWTDAICNYPNDDFCKEPIKKIRTPTLILHGGKDALVPDFHPNYLHANIPGSRILLWPEAKHNLHLKYHTQFNKEVASFLSLH